MVAANITAGWTSEVEVDLPRVRGRESVQFAAGRVNGREVLVLAERVVRRHDTDDHVIEAGLGQGAVVDSEGDVSAEE